MRVIGSRRAARVASAAAALAVASCGDGRIGNLSEGIGRDSALRVLAGGATADSLANVYKQETYINDGRMINVLMYNKDGVKESDQPGVPDSELTPVVTVDGKVTGWGWTHYDSVARANNIPVKDHK